ncbi:MAG TPA: sugar transferase [Longimicrobiales bacterium]|nr:sugar transferase [Longimicrobiales bacterium]
MTRSKRTLDILLAASGLAVLSPLLVVIAAAVRMSDGGDALFWQTRVGRGGRPFRMAKFRTMRLDADRMGPAVTIGQDPRITRLGTVLRRLKLDELPQLWNVLRGEMSFVGPRPEVPRYVELYSPEQRRVLDLVPGITDPASLRFRDEASVLQRYDDPEQAYVNEVMPAKLRENLEYAARANLATDVGLIVRTVLHIGR